MGEKELWRTTSDKHLHDRAAVFGQGLPEQGDSLPFPDNQILTMACLLQAEHAPAGSNLPVAAENKQKKQFKQRKEAGLCSLADNILRIKPSKAHDHGHCRRPGDTQDQAVQGDE